MEWTHSFNSISLVAQGWCLLHFSSIIVLHKQVSPSHSYLVLVPLTQWPNLHMLSPWKCGIGCLCKIVWISICYLFRSAAHKVSTSSKGWLVGTWSSTTRTKEKNPICYTGRVWKGQGMLFCPCDSPLLTVGGSFVEFLKGIKDAHRVFSAVFVQLCFSQSGPWCICLFPLLSSQTDSPKIKQNEHF